MILAPTARKLQQSHHQNICPRKGRGNTPPRQAPQKVTLTGKDTVDATVHPPPPPPETSSRSSSSSSGCYSHRRKHKHRHSHRRKHKRRHHRSRRYSVGNYYPGSITCAPPLPRSLQDRIRRGKFVMLDKLLLPQNVPPTPKVGKGNAKWSKRHVVDLLHGSRHGTDTYALGLPTTFPWLSSSSSVRQSW